MTIITATMSSLFPVCSCSLSRSVCSFVLPCSGVFCFNLVAKYFGGVQESNLFIFLVI